jgi:hypothetical protein
LHVYQWFFQGIVQDIVDGRTLVISVDLGFQTWKAIPIKFNRLRILSSNDQLYCFFRDHLKDKRLYFHTIRNKDRFGGERFFAEFYIDLENFPVIKEKSLSLREINLTLATEKMKPESTGKVDGLININDFLVRYGLAEYVDNIPLRHGPSRRPAQVSDGIEDREETGHPNYSSRSRPPSERPGPHPNAERIRRPLFKKILRRMSKE